MRTLTAAKEPGPDPAKDRLFVTALSRGLDILRCFTFERPELTVKDIAGMTGLPYPTVWRLCHTLAESGYIVQHKDSARLGLGIPVLSLGFAVLARYKIADIARPYMQDMTDRLKVGMTLAARDGLDMVYLQRCHGDFVYLNHPVGSRLSIATTGTGWAYVAGTSEEERKSVMDAMRRADPKSWAETRAGIEEAVAEYRRSGMIFCLRVRHPEMNIVAVPVRSVDGSTVLGLAASGLASVWTKAKLKPVGEKLISIAAKLAPALGVG